MKRGKQKESLFFRNEREIREGIFIFIFGSVLLGCEDAKGNKPENQGEVKWRFILPFQH